MKNIFILPTDKPSRLFELSGNLHLHTELGFDYKRSRNIYITSDEEIKDGTWLPKSYKKILESSVGYKKIILTTDQDLINYGIQAIDDEFLEWFVKNPTCEFVEIEKEHDDTVPYPKMRYVKPYKIIIPKEEPKHISLVEKIKPLQEQWQKDMEATLNPKQETLEEASIMYYPTYPDGIITSEIHALREGFVKGFEVAQKRSYSEEEVGEIVYNIIGQYGKHYGIMIDGNKLNELFKQFKKK